MDVQEKSFYLWNIVLSKVLKFQHQHLADDDFPQANRLLPHQIQTVLSALLLVPLSCRLCSLPPILTRANKICFKVFLYCKCKKEFSSRNRC